MRASATQKQLRAIGRGQRRHMVAERKRQQVQQRAEQQEQRDEAIAPAAQRLPVLGRDGEVIRGARLERDGITFIRSNPIKALAKRGEGKAQPLLGKRHVDAGDRLQRAWEEGGQGVTAGVANYGVRIGEPTSTGVIAETTLHAVHRQIKARTEIECIKTYLGARWGAVYSVVIVGVPPSVWGEAVGMNPATSVGYVVACMDALCDFYAGPERRGRIRMVQIESPAGREAAD